MEGTSAAPLLVTDGRGPSFGRHYIRDIVYAANDGIATTFAALGIKRASSARPLQCSG